MPGYVTNRYTATPSGGEIPKIYIIESKRYVKAFGSVNSRYTKPPRRYATLRYGSASDPRPMPQPATNGLESATFISVVPENYRCRRSLGHVVGATLRARFLGRDGRRIDTQITLNSRAFFSAAARLCGNSQAQSRRNLGRFHETPSDRPRECWPPTVARLHFPKERRRSVHDQPATRGPFIDLARRERSPHAQRSCAESFNFRAKPSERNPILSRGGPDRRRRQGWHGRVSDQSSLTTKCDGDSPAR
jgi:hypothetical protein